MLSTKINWRTEKNESMKNNSTKINQEQQKNLGHEEKCQLQKNNNNEKNWNTKINRSIKYDLKKFLFKIRTKKNESTKKKKQVLRKIRASHVQEHLII